MARKLCPVPLFAETDAVPVFAFAMEEQEEPELCGASRKGKSYNSFVILFGAGVVRKAVFYALVGVLCVCARL